MSTPSYKVLLERFEKEVAKQANDRLERMLENDRTVRHYSNRDLSVHKIIEGEIKHFIDEYLGFGSFGDVKKDSPLYAVLRESLDKIAATKGQALIDRIVKRFVFNKRQETEVERAFKEGYEGIMRNKAYKAGQLKAEKDANAVLKRMKLHVNLSGEEDLG